ncbi:MAG: hypothetical protein ACYSUN_07335, partial [Planctomycetota bacterium]|jgi:hypothetical protein
VDAWADPLGGFAFVGLLPGRYRVEVDPGDPLLEGTAREIDFSRGGYWSGARFTLRPKRVGKLRLVILEPDGSPATGVSFQLGDSSLHARQVGDGIYELILGVGEREVQVIRAGFVAEPVAVRIRAGHTLERTVPLRPQEE